MLERTPSRHNGSHHWTTRIRGGLIRGFESHIKRRATFRYLNDLEQSQWESEAELAERQTAALQNLLKHAERHCEFYRNQWQTAGLQSRDLKALADFQAWPVIDRETIRTHRAAMQSNPPDEKLLTKSTGGSSGVPLTFDLSFDSHDRRVAASQRGYNWAGAFPGTNQIYLWGVPLGDRSPAQRIKGHLYDRILYRRRILNTFDLSEERLLDYFAAWNRCRADVAVAYTGPLYLFARMLKDRGLEPVSPRSIIVGAEKLYPFQRELIEEVFAAPVFETYGSREFMLIAAECDRHEGLHLTSEHLLLEILDDDGRPAPKGEVGNVVVTDLYNLGMPFIRYANGDRAVAGWETCSCGRGLPLLREVTGRRLDVLQSPDGRHLPGEFFPHLIKDFPAVRRFQAVQDRPDAVQLKLVVTDDWNTEQALKLERQIRRQMGDALKLECSVVADIPLTRSGKLQVVVNRCRPSQEKPESPCESLR